MREDGGLHSLPVFTCQSVIIPTSPPLIGLIYEKSIYAQLILMLFQAVKVQYRCPQAGIQFMYVGLV